MRRVDDAPLTDDELEGIDRVPSLGARAVAIRQFLQDRRVRHRAHVTEYGEDLPEVREWRWRG